MNMSQVHDTTLTMKNTKASKAPGPHRTYDRSTFNPLAYDYIGHIRFQKYI